LKIIYYKEDCRLDCNGEVGFYGFP